MKPEIQKKSFGTHNGSFHADEVTACALLLLFNQIDFGLIIRSRDFKKLSHCDYLCDVGGVYKPEIRRFDHHQKEYKGDLSSAGMVLQYLKDEGIIEKVLFDYFNRSLIVGIDAIDNGREEIIPGHCSFSGVIANFVPVRHDVDEKVMDEAFFKALEFTYEHLKRLLERFHYIQECRKVVEEEMKKRGEVMTFSSSMPWMESFFDLGGENHPALFLIMPSGGQWKLRGIPPSYDEKMQVRVPLPKEWAGLSQDRLKCVTGIPGAVFCHKGRFISIWQTREDALKALEMILQKEKQ